MTSQLEAAVNDPSLKELFGTNIRTIVVNALPDDVLKESPDASYFDITIDWRGKGTWAVVAKDKYVYDKNGSETYEPLPSARTEAFLSQYRHSLEEAVRIAEQIVAPNVKFMRFTVDSFTEWWREKKEEL